MTINQFTVLAGLGLVALFLFVNQAGAKRLRERNGDEAIELIQFSDIPSRIGPVT